MARLALSLGTAITLMACSQHDLTGHELTAAEGKALNTCDNWMQSGFHSSLGGVDIKRSRIRSEQDGIHIAWQAKTKVGEGIVVCSTTKSGEAVTSGLIDGIQVRP